MESLGKAPQRVRGYLFGIIAAVSYGSNPLFAVPLYAMGMRVGSVLWYRYVFGAVLLGLVLTLTGRSLRLPLKDIPFMAGEGILFALSSLCLFESYRYMDVGIATTLLFMVPVFVALIMWAGFGERLSAATMVALGLSVCGIGLLYDPSGGSAGLWGIVLVCMSSLAYAIYMVAVNRSRLARLDSGTLTFYSLVFGSLVFSLYPEGVWNLQEIPACPEGWLNVIGIAIVPTVLSLVAVAAAIHDVGSVVVSLLGGLEPVTGILIGTLMFGERLNPHSIAGIALIFISVFLVVLLPSGRKCGSTG